MRGWWKRYLHWRNNPPPRRVVPETKTISKLDVEDSTAIAHLHSNPGAPSGGMS